MSDVNPRKNKKQKGFKSFFRLSLKLNKGVSLLYAVLLMSILLAIGFGVSGILLPQIKMLGDIGYSVVAFYAADAGIEKILMERGGEPSDIPETDLDHGASYKVFVEAGGEGDCPSEKDGRTIHFCIKSVGAYGDVKRAIEINY